MKLAQGPGAPGVHILGTSPDAIDLAEDRGRFGALLAAEGIRQPENGTALTVAEGVEVAREIGFPVLVRPSYVLGGRAMAICYDETTLLGYLRDAAEVAAGQPILLDRFLDDAIEVDLDLLADGRRAVVAGILQHIEEAGIHSGDSAAVLPPQSVGPAEIEQMREIGRRLAHAIGCGGSDERPVRHPPGRSLRLGGQSPGVANRALYRQGRRGAAGQPCGPRHGGSSLEELGFTREPEVPGIFVKAPVFPFRRFPGVDPVLGPEMKSTGEVMGSSSHFGGAFAKAWIAAGHQLPLEGAAFLSVHDQDKEALLPVARRLAELGFELLATAGTAEYLAASGLVTVRRVHKVHEERPHVVDHLINREIDLVVNTPLGRESHEDDALIRRTALKHDIPCITTLSGALAAAEGIAALRDQGLEVASLQELAR